MNMQRFWAFLTVSFFIILTSGCSPAIYPMGPAIQEATLIENAFVMADGAVLPVKKWQSDGPTKAIILGLHGMNDYSNAFNEPAMVWSKNGIMTYAYDQRGFGESPHRGSWSGVETMVADALAASKILKNMYPETPLILLGESMGGAVALNAMLDDGLLADRIVLSAPAVWGRQVMPWYQRWPLWLAAHTIPTAVMLPKLKIHPSDNIEMLRALGRDPLIIRGAKVETIWGLTNLMDAAYDSIPEIRRDSLIMYGKKEDIIPESATTGMISRLPNDPPKSWRLVIYDKGYHMLMRDLNADLVLSDIASYTLDKDAALPSGHEIIGDQ